MTVVKSVLLCLLLTSIFLACRQTPMSEQTTFPYLITVTAPQEYPVEVHLGYLSDGDDFISAIPKSGAEFQGWIATGANAGVGASHIPSFLELTWVSYAEKKFWKVATPLPKEKMLALFREGYMGQGIKPTDPLVHKTYDELVIGLAPGGVVAVWLDDGTRRVEVGRYQADTVWVDKDKFRPIPKEDETEAQFFETFYDIHVPEATKEQLQKEGIPYGLWDRYRKKYNWRFNTVFYKPDFDQRQYIRYLNGESNVFFKDALAKKLVSLQAVPYSGGLVFSVKNADAYFDEKETMAAFEELTKDNPQEPLEIVGKVGFMYKDMTFSVKSKDKEIPLRKVRVKLYSNN